MLFYPCQIQIRIFGGIGSGFVISKESNPDFFSKKSNAEELEEEEVKEEGPYDWIMHLQKQRANV